MIRKISICLLTLLVGIVFFPILAWVLFMLKEGGSALEAIEDFRWPEFRIIASLPSLAYAVGMMCFGLLWIRKQVYPQGFSGWSTWIGGYSIVGVILGFISTFLIPPAVRLARLGSFALDLAHAAGRLAIVSGLVCALLISAIWLLPLKRKENQAEPSAAPDR